MKNLVTSAAILASLAVVGGASAAQAFDFKTNYTAALEGSNKWKGDLTLDSVEFGGQTYTDFAFAQRTKIVSNDVWGGGNSGAASADMGDLVDIAGLENRSFREAGSAEALTLALGNNNLNSIVDTEDKGNFAIDVLFDTAVDNVLVWERGRNSALDVQAIGKDGNVVGNLLALGKSNKGGWSNAGFSLNTKEIGGTQKVASIGVSLADLGLTDAIYGVRVISRGKSYNGPDWKLAGTASSAAVPEPFSMIGAGLALGAGALLKNRKK